MPKAIKNLTLQQKIDYLDNYNENYESHVSFSDIIEKDKINFLENNAPVLDNKNNCTAWCPENDVDIINKIMQKHDEGEI